jgi:hypothetical protein
MNTLAATQITLLANRHVVKVDASAPIEEDLHASAAKRLEDKLIPNAINGIDCSSQQGEFSRGRWLLIIQERGVFGRCG